MKNGRILKFIPVLALGLSLFSAAMILFFILKYGVDVPYNDQWEYVGFFDHFSLGILTFEELFRLHNEYRQFFPNLIYVLLGSVTDWNVIWEMVVIFILACLVSFNIYKLACYTIQGAPWKKWILFFLANLFIFSPMQWENWIFGVQIEYLLPIACISAGLVVAFLRINAPLKMLWCAVLSVISTYSSVNGFLSWFVLIPVLYFSGVRNVFFKKWYAILLWIVITAAALLFYLYDYHKPEAHPSLETAVFNPADAVLYFFGTLGNTLRVIHNLDAIILVGGLLFFLFAAQVLYVMLHIRNKALVRDAIVWIMLGAYSVLTSAMLTVGRLGFGIPQSLASRYTSFTLYIDIAIIFLTAVILHHRTGKSRTKPATRAVTTLLAVFVIFTKIYTYPVAVNELKAYHAHILHAKAGLLFINHIPHEDCTHRIYPGKHYQELTRTANILDNMGYLRPALIRTNILQDIEEPWRDSWDYGSFEELIHVRGDVYKAAGTASFPETQGPADAVLLSYDLPDGRAALLAMTNRDSIRWEKEFSVQAVSLDTLEVRAWAFNATTGKAYRLKNSLSLVRESPSLKKE